MLSDVLSPQTEEGEAPAGSLTVRAREAAAAFELAPLLAHALKHHAAMGDPQTPCAVLLALSRHRFTSSTCYCSNSMVTRFTCYLVQSTTVWNIKKNVIANRVFVFRSDLFPYIDEGTQEHWLLGYIEFLQRHKLWNRATEVSDRGDGHNFSPY